MYIYCVCVCVCVREREREREREIVRNMKLNKSIDFWRPFLDTGMYHGCSDIVYKNPIHSPHTIIMFITSSTNIGALFKKNAQQIQFSNHERGGLPS